MALAELSRIKSSVPGQYLGYGLQPVRLCFHALDIPTGWDVSLEYLDDVAIHGPDGEIILEQTKSALTGNPSAERSKELWNTLANWSELCSSGTVNADTTSFRYYVTPNKTSALVEKLNGAKDDETASHILETFKKKKFQGKAGVGIEPNIQRFLSSGDKTCIKIIKGFIFQTEPSPLDSIRAKLNSLLPDETLDKFCSAAVGIAKDEIEELIRAGKSPIISAGHFRKKLRAFIKKYDFSNLLIPTISAPSSQEVSGVINKLPLFVRQLTSINASETLITSAVNDFLRSTSDKINWAADGDVVKDSFEELDTSLLRHHLLQYDEIEDVYKQLSPEERGRRLYRKCIELRTKLEGRELPDYFIPGEFNFLSEESHVGWHPDYKTLLCGEV